MRIKISKIFQWIGIFLIVLLGILVLALLALFYTTNQMINKTYTVTPEPLEISTDPEIIERGRYIVTTRGACTECHGEKLTGEVFDEGFLVGRFVIPNLTAGEGGVGAEFSEADWVRAIRYGVKPDGRSLIGMPSEYFNLLSDNDLAAVIAYLRSVPPVDTEYPEHELGPMFRWFILQEPTALPASLIDHSAPRPAEPVPGVTVEYGKYLSSSCRLCHMENMAGGTEPGAGLNLTPGGDLGKWTEEQFIQTLRTGVTPSGKKLDPELMPWKSMGKMTEEDLQAIWLYLKSLPSVQDLPTAEPTQ